MLDLPMPILILPRSPQAKLLRDTIDFPRLSERLLKGDLSVFVVATGAGASLQSALWSPPGASAFLVGSQFTYETHETDAFLGHQPGNYCSEFTTISLAIEAYVRAKVRNFTGEYNPRPAIGLGLTASVASTRAHRGDHRVHVAVISDLPSGSFITTHTLEKGVGPEARLADEEIATLAGLDILEVALGLKEPKDHTPIIPETIRNQIMCRPYTNGILRGTYPNIDPKAALFPGAFNPAQDAHRYMSRIIVATGHASKTVYNICIDHKHKPPLQPLDMLTRMAAFRAELVPDANDYATPRPHLLFTQGDPLFVDKMRGRPASTWLMGADTLDKMLDPKWGPSSIEVAKVIEDTKSQFIVFNCEYEGSWLTVDSVLARYLPHPVNFTTIAKRILTLDDKALPNSRSSRIRAQAAEKATASG